jgi:hypothetical protein
LNLQSLVTKEVNEKMPLLMISLKGFNCSYFVEELAGKIGKRLSVVAIGDGKTLE